uniref:Methyltransferase type 11 domain-containing protein n=1 Tax=Helicotheca tamesis TaxID=374047 RepID=A0A7S2I4N2_9STRA|mmetsp:Transcript_5667/g.7778  ORF Transcript_5667/g.7778 Transcript_5667/m.7778 type:complete len:399 (+) Transcript_5667:87-1283(+)
MNDATNAIASNNIHITSMIFFLLFVTTYGAHLSEGAFVASKTSSKSSTCRCTQSVSTNNFLIANEAGDLKKRTMPLTHNCCRDHASIFFKSQQLMSSLENFVSGEEGDGDMATSSASRRRFMKSLGITAATSLAQVQTSSATITDPKTGIAYPSEGEIETSIPSSWDDADNPFESLGRDAFARLDSSPDTFFYTDPRFVEHVDSNTVQSMTSYLSDGGWALRPGDEVLDLCSSWTSHIDGTAKEKLGLKRISGLGMNAEELKANTVLTDWVVKDLNTNEATLPYEDSSFDVVLCQLSIDYLTHPLEVMKEVGRVLRPGGRVVILFSNRLFIQKAVGLWTGADDVDHAYTVASYLHYSNGGFESIKAQDLSTRKGKGKDRPVVGDPLYAVTAIRSSKST